MQQSIDISCPPGPQTCSNGFAAVGPDGQTPYRFVDAAPHTMRVVSEMQQTRGLRGHSAVLTQSHPPRSTRRRDISVSARLEYNVLLFIQSLRLRQGNLPTASRYDKYMQVSRKVKVARTRLSNVRFRSSSRFLAVSLQVL